MTPSWNDMWHVFGRIGLMSFGGPAAQIGVMHQELVEKRPWLSESQYLRALSFCMLLPGPEAMQLATYAGWRMRGVAGGLLAGLLFVVPGAIVITALAMLYGTYGRQPIVQAVFVGVQATVVIVVIAALRNVARKALTRRTSWLLALFAFLALFFFAVPFPLIIVASAIVGANWLPGKADQKATFQLSITATLVTILGGLVLWSFPLLLAMAAGATFLVELGLFFSKLAVVSFGGAYAVLSYMTQTVVQDYGWINTTQMMDALGLAETTPGPLILVTQFVGMLAGLAQSGWPMAMAAGLLTLWVTFVPCFIWIFAGAPLIEWLSGQPRLQGALAGITAAVVGVIANLSLWFGLHVFFADLHTLHLGPATVILPVPQSLSPIATALGLFSAVMILWRGWPLLRTLGASGLMALCFYLLFGG